LVPTPLAAHQVAGELAVEILADENQQVVLGRHVVVRRAEGDAELRREAPHGEAIDADLTDHLARHPDDLQIREPNSVVCGHEPPRNTARAMSLRSRSSVVRPSNWTAPFSMNTARAHNDAAMLRLCSTSTSVSPVSCSRRT